MMRKDSFPKSTDQRQARSGFAIFLPKMLPEIKKTEENLSANLAKVRERIELAATRAGRKPGEIELVAVSKTYGIEILQAAIRVGAACFGENRVQEAEAKIAAIGSETVRWHLIGNLQANKARKAVRLFDLIHSLDSTELALRLERLCAEENRAELPVLIQVDLAGEATKSGIREKDLPALIEIMRSFQHLRLRGLMVLPPFFDDAELARPFFRRLREIRDELEKQKVFGNHPGELSMGMSGDFEIAIEEGSTLVRVGTAIFGTRNRN
jgi:pyridoxal phosphate enzyme (YggS family)